VGNRSKQDGERRRRMRLGEEDADGGLESRSMGNEAGENGFRQARFSCPFE
jgi:hypothetical protein